ncbi:HNH endonuclease [Caballeronia jiangsuensis]|nr:HNH endonuclease [Caballeronia jiangsuensis]
MTQKALKEALHYNPETGIFTFLKSMGSSRKGKQVGHNNPKRYVSITLNGVTFYAHRLAFLYMTGAFPKEATDHINRNRSDNRWCNLRAVSIAENNQNYSLRKDNTSGYRGVSFHKNKKKWLAYIVINKKRNDLGYFDTAAEAGAVADAARSKHFVAYVSTTTGA